jgi:hypothetical protein
MIKIIILFVTILFFAMKTFAQIEGDIVDEKDEGVPNAIIIASDSTGKVIDTVKSDKRGYYEFKGLRSGKYIIKAKVPGFVSAVYQNIEVSAAPTRANDGDDTYYAIRLDISLIRVKVPK